jgi:hypothetical protein
VLTSGCNCNWCPKNNQNPKLLVCKSCTESYANLYTDLYTCRQPPKQQTNCKVKGKLTRPFICSSVFVFIVLYHSHIFSDLESISILYRESSMWFVPVHWRQFGSTHHRWFLCSIQSRFCVSLLQLPAFGHCSRTFT